MSELQTLCNTTGFGEAAAVRFVRQFFGEDATEYDFKVVGAAFSLRSLPPSYAATAIVKTMRGTAKGKVAKKRPEYGLVQGMRQYKNQTLFDLAEAAMKWLQQGDALETEELIESDDPYDSTPPAFLRYGDSQHLANKETCETIGKIFVECGKKHGKAAPEPERQNTSNATPKELWEKLDDNRIVKEAAKIGKKLIKEFLKTNTDWKDDELFKSGSPTYSKSVRKKVLTASFFLPSEKQWRVLSIKKTIPHPEYERLTKDLYKAPILVSKWTLDGQLIENGKSF